MKSVQMKIKLHCGENQLITQLRPMKFLVQGYVVPFGFNSVRETYSYVEGGGVYVTITSGEGQDIAKQCVTDYSEYGLNPENITAKYLSKVSIIGTLGLDFKKGMWGSPVTLISISFKDENGKLYYVKPRTIRDYNARLAKERIF